MNHRGKVRKDHDSNLWSGHCDCSVTWNASRWSDVYQDVYSHVSARRKAQAIGIGFTSAQKGKISGT